MLTKERIQEVVEKHFWEDDFFLVDIQLVPGKRIVVYIDREAGVTIDECAELSQGIYRTLESEIADMELTVSSPGLDMPLKIPAQYLKNLTREVEVLTNDGKKFSGKLVSAGAEGFAIHSREKGSVEGKKKKDWQTFERRFEYGEVKSTRLRVSFK